MFCLKCEEYACAECISSDKHLGHELRSLKHIYNEIKDISAEESKQLDLYLEQLENHEIKFKKIKKDKVEIVDKAHQSINGFICTLLSKNTERING